MRVVIAVFVAALVVPATVQARPPSPDVPLVLLVSPVKANLGAMPETGKTQAQPPLEEQAAAKAEAQVRPAGAAMATTARKKRGRTIARAASPGHGCYGQTDRPHRSGHRPGYVTVRSRTVCGPHTVGVTVHLYKLIFGQWYFRDGASGNGVGTVAANAATPGTCGTWYASAGHSAALHYPAGTSNQATTC